MPRISREAESTARLAVIEGQKPKPPASAGLTPEQAGYWRSIVEDLPPGHIRSDNTPVLCELVRHLAISQQISEALSDMRDLKLAFLQLTRQARAQTQLIAVLIVKLRFTNQSREGSNGVTNAARLRQPHAVRPAPVGIHSWWSER